MVLRMSQLMSFLILTVIIGISSIVHGSSIYKQKPILTIKTEKAQVYDCVDFYKQPAFNDPIILKNQIHQINETYLQNQVGEVKSLGLKDIGCPLGTVPILRSMEMDALQYPSTSTEFGEHCTAVVRTRGNVGRSFFEAIGTVTLYNATVHGNQWSSSRIKFLNGPDSIEAGWMVNPSLFKDSEAHFYGMFKAGSKGCVNLLCPGFVQVSKDVPLGGIPPKYSHPSGSEIFSWEISIEQHRDDGNWWLSLNNKPVGYWPKSLFTTLGASASQIEWGGESDNPEPSSTPKPFMGSGLTARDDTRLSSFFFQVKAVENHLRIDPPKDTEKYEDCGDYTTYDAGNKGTQWGRAFFYGGPYNV